MNPGPVTKQEMRAAMKRVLLGFSADELSARGAWVADRLSRTDAWRAADLVLCFLSMPHELDTSSIIRAARKAGKRLAVPRIEGERVRFLLLSGDPGDLPRDRLGIPVPDPSWPAADLATATVPLVAAPGLAFDRAGNRLGRGGGFYDRFLSAARGEARGLVAIGICLAEQLMEGVPHAGTDQRVDGVVTDRETVLLPLT